MLLAWLRSRFILLGLLATALGVLAYLALVNDQRSFVVQAQTHGLQLEFHGSLSRPWSLAELVLCLRRPGRPSGAASVEMPVPAQANCDPRLFEVRQLADVIVEWPNGVTVSVAHVPGGPGLEFEVRALPAAFSIAGVPVPVHSRLIIPEAVWVRTAKLLFSGFPVFGSDSNSATGDHLVSGRFEVRETPFLRGNPVKVLEGELFTGDVAKLVDLSDSGPVAATGFLALTHGDEAGNGFEVIAYSGLGDTAMEIQRPGVVPTKAMPSWTDRALSDPLILAGTALLALVVAMSELTGVLRGLYAWCRRWS